MSKIVYQTKRSGVIPTLLVTSAGGGSSSGGGGTVPIPTENYYTKAEADALYVHLAGDETIAGEKDFTEDVLVGGTFTAYYGTNGLQVYVAPSGSYHGYIDSVRDSATNSMIFRMRTAGTPITAMTIRGTGNIEFENDLGTATFSAGFAGSGWKLDNASGEYNLEVDNLTVRKGMNIYELTIQRIKATNGAVIVSPGSGKILTVTYVSPNVYDLTIDTDGGDLPLSITNYDVLRCQNFNGRNTKYYVGYVQVGTVTSTGFQLGINAGTGIPEVGDELVVMGNTHDSTRRGFIYITSSDTNAPYIDVLDGVNGATIDDADRKVRLGKLTGITDADFGGALSGYGLYSTNAYLKGGIFATFGEIGGWEIDNDSIYTGAKSTADGYNEDSSGGITLAGDGSIHAPNFALNADGSFNFRTALETNYFEFLDDSLNFYSSDVLKTTIDMNAGRGQPTMMFHDTGTYYNWFFPDSIRYGTALGTGQEVCFWGLNYFQTTKPLRITAGARLTPRVITTNGTSASDILTTDGYIVWNYTTGNGTITFPSTPEDGQVVIVTNMTTARTLTVDGGDNDICVGGTTAGTNSLPPRRSAQFIFSTTADVWFLVGASG